MKEIIDNLHHHKRVDKIKRKYKTYGCSLIVALVFNIAVLAQNVRSIDWHMFPDTGVVEAEVMKQHGGFDYVQRGFGNGPESNHNDAYNVSLQDDVAGTNSGRWAKILSQKWPGPNTVHTFGKAIRAVNLGLASPFSYDETWIDVPLWIPDEWITHNQGKLGYSLGNPYGTNPGTNPTDSFEFLFHYFSCNTAKVNRIDAPWYSENPMGPFEEQDMLIGLDVYANDERVNTHFSEPIFFKENIGSTNRKVFNKNRHYVLRAHIKLNTPGDQNGVLEGWYSEDGGNTWIKSVEVFDFDWRGERDFKFEQEGFVAFRGGNGPGFEVGGDSSYSQNTGLYNAPQDAWYFIGKIDLYDVDPFLTNTNETLKKGKSNLLIEPNPNAGVFRVVSEVLQANKAYLLKIYSLRGDVLVQRRLIVDEIIHLPGFSSGNYVVVVFDDKDIILNGLIEINN